MLCRCYTHVVSHLVTVQPEDMKGEGESVFSQSAEFQLTFLLVTLTLLLANIRSGAV